MAPDSRLRIDSAVSFSSTPIWCCALLLLTVLYIAAVDAQQGDYVIGAEDVLSISMISQQDLSGKFEVDTDGTFTFPMLGRVKAAGLTARQVEVELKKRLAEGFFQNPELTVSIDAYASQRIFIVGEVKQPGSYPIRGNITLLEALTLAGSINTSAATEIVVVRPPPGQGQKGPLLPGASDAAQVFRINLNQLENGVVTQNITLQSGDTVFVPRPATVFVTGQVRSPGAYPAGPTTTVLQVLSLAGGVTDRGASNRLKVIRIVDGKSREVSIKPTDVVKSGDTVVVPERFF